MIHAIIISGILLLGALCLWGFGVIEGWCSKIFTLVNNTEKQVRNVLGKSWELEQTCEELLEDVNRRYPDKDRTDWDCPYFQKISELIDYK